MFNYSPAHLATVCQALLVTFLWSLSWVLLKFGPHDVPALTYAGLYYRQALFCLLPLFLKFGGLLVVKKFTRRDWLNLTRLGFIYYVIKQGAQFLGLVFLSVITVRLPVNRSDTNGLEGERN